jgi:hypothetical protein
MNLIAKTGKVMEHYGDPHDVEVKAIPFFYIKKGPEEYRKLISCLTFPQPNQPFTASNHVRR